MLLQVFLALNTCLPRLLISLDRAGDHISFDFGLLSVQLEAEFVITEHLKRIKAYLEPGAHYSARPQAAPNKKLKASIIIPVNNRPIFIIDAIESVQAQTIKDI